MNMFAGKRPVSKQAQRGVAAVELTITLPLLLLLMFAAAEVGRFLYQYNTLTKAVEGGARYLASEVRSIDTPGQLAAAKTSTENLVRYGTLDSDADSVPLLPGPNVVSVVSDTAATGVNPVTVSATYTYDPMIFPTAILQSIDLNIPIIASIGMPVL